METSLDQKIVRRNVLVISIASALIWMSMYSYVPTLPDYATALGASATLVGIIGGAYGILQIVLRIPLGIIADKTGRDKLLLIVGFIVLAIASLIFIFSKDAYTLVLARGVAGAAAAWWVILSATFAKYHTTEKQVKAQGALGAAANLGKVAACVLGGLFAQYFGAIAPFYIAFVVAIGGIICVLFFKTPPKAERREPVSVKTLLALLKLKDLVVFSIICLLAQLLCFAIPSYFMSISARDLGADSLTIGTLTAFYFGISSIASLFVGTRLYKKIGGIKSVVLSFVAGAISCIPMFYTVNIPLLFVMQGLSGICYGIAVAALAGFVILSVPPAMRGAATGIFQSIFGIGIFAGPFITGLVLDHLSFAAAYWIICAISVAAAILSATLIPKKYDKM